MKAIFLFLTRTTNVVVESSDKLRLKVDSNNIVNVINIKQKIHENLEEKSTNEINESEELFYSIPRDLVSFFVCCSSRLKSMEFKGC